MVLLILSVIFKSLMGFQLIHKRLFLALLLTFTPSPNISLAHELDSRIMSFKNQTRIYCVSELMDSPMFTSPPLEKLRDAENLLEVRGWENDDWEMKSSTQIISYVKDKRWEEFSITYTNYVRFTELKISVSFSIYGSDKVEFFAYDAESLCYFKQDIDSKDEFTNFTVYFSNSFIYIYMENHLVNQHFIKPMQLVLKTPNEAYFKIYKYKYKEAVSVTKTKEEATILTIPQSDKSSLIVYSSLCKLCVLEVTYGDQSFNIVSNEKESDVFQQWQSFKINVNTNVANKVEFIRKKFDEAKDGFWRLDARLYADGINTVKYRYNETNSDKSYTCRRFPSNKNSTTKTNLENPNYSNCLPGFVGEKCNIKCEAVLGQQYSKCQEHQICNSVNCHCATGYNGTWCEKECDDGSWGINCEHRCPNCALCNKQTGTCEVQRTVEQGSINQWMYGVILFLACTVMIMIVVLVLMRRKYNLYSRTSTDNHIARTEGQNYSRENTPAAD